MSICHVVPVANIKYAIPFNGDSALENHQMFAITKAQCKISAYSLFLFGLCSTKAAAVVNNAVRRGKNGEWEFKLEKSEQRYQDMFDQGQPYEVAEHMWAAARS